MPPHPSESEALEIIRFLGESGVAPEARILDAPCGLGRRARELAEHGFRVTAVDPNEVAVETLRKRVGKGLAARLDYRAAPFAKLPDLPASERFDAVLCLDHGISREPAEDDVAFLRRLRGHTAPGGLLLVDLLHRDFFASRPRPFAYHVIGKLEQHEFRAFDATTGVLRLTWKFYEREGKDLRFRGSSDARLKLLTPTEAVALLLGSGWDVTGVYGGWGKEAVSAERRKIVLVARPARD